MLDCGYAAAVRVDEAGTSFGTEHAQGKLMCGIYCAKSCDRINRNNFSPHIFPLSVVIKVKLLGVASFC